MDCRHATTAILERSFGTLDPDREAALLAHLDGCPACAVKAGEEAGLSDALALLRTEPPFEFDVADRVLNAVAAFPPPRRETVPGRQLVWAGLAAAVLTVALVVSGAFLAPSMLGVAQGAGHAIVSTCGFLARLGRAAVETLGAMKPLFRAAWDVLTTASMLIRKADPLLRGAAAVIFLGMLILTSAVIGRDLRSRAPADRR
jgi:hypothetical protein